MDHSKIIKRIPGELSGNKKEHQGYLDDLSQKEKSELEELLIRQNRILANKQFVSKLPDEGKKIIALRDKLIKEMEYKNEIEKAALLFSQLNIASKGKEAMDELEWTGKYSEKTDSTKVVELDSDDEENPLKILAQPTGAGVHKKKIVYLKPEETLIQPTDLEEIKSFRTNEVLEMEHVKYIVNLVEKSKEGQEQKREPFRPYKTTISNVHDPSKEKDRKCNKHWEVTAATPPLIVHEAVKTLNMTESLKLEKERVEKLKEIQIQHAAQRLGAQAGLHQIGFIPKIEGSHRRDSRNSTSSSDDEEKEVYDDEDDDKGGTITYKIDSTEM